MIIFIYYGRGETHRQEKKSIQELNVIIERVPEYIGMDRSRRRNYS